ncbi:phage tail protein [Vibrio fluvialis]
MSKFFTVLTTVGEAKLANATALGQTVQFEKLAIGDGNGQLPVPNQNQTELVNEVRRELLNAVETDPDNPNWIICEQVVPEDVGGWTIREVGIYDIDGDLIAVGNFPETYKPILEEGSGRTQTVRVVLQISATDTVELKIDPSVVLATRKYVDDSLHNIGLSVESPPLLNSFDALDKKSGSIYRTDATTTGSQPLAGVNGVVRYERWGANDFIMFFWPATLASSVVRSRRWKKGVGFTSWEYFFTSENLKFASEAEAKEGTNNTKVVTPLNVSQAITQFGLGIKSPPLLDSFNSLDKLNNSTYRTDATTAGDNPTPGLNGVVRYERWGDNDFMMYHWIASQPVTTLRLRRWKIGTGFGPWQYVFTSENLTPYTSHLLFDDTNGAGDGTVIDWSSTGKVLDDFEYLAVSGFLMDTTGNQFYVSGQLPVDIAKTVTGASKYFQVGEFTAKGTATNDVRLSLTGIGQTQATVTTLAQGYSGAITRIEGIVY